MGADRRLSYDADGEFEEVNCDCVPELVPKHRAQAATGGSTNSFRNNRGRLASESTAGEDLKSNNCGGVSRDVRAETIGVPEVLERGDLKIGQKPCLTSGVCALMRRIGKIPFPNMRK